MNQNYSEFLPLRVTHIGPDGKRRYDKRDKQRLIEVCLQPGTSVAGMALKAGVNANLLRRWIRLYEDRRGGTVAEAVAESAPAVFVPVIEVDCVRTKPEAPPSVKPDVLPARREAVHASQRPPLPSRLVAQLPNGVSLELECSGQDSALLKAMIDALKVR